MINRDDLLTEAESGFEGLKISQKYVDSALKWLKIWLTDDAFKDYTAQIEHLINAENWNFLLDSFYQVIPFGTGGRRGLVGVGPNRINTWTIQASAQGHSQYLTRQYGDEDQQRGEHRRAGQQRDAVRQGEQGQHEVAGLAELEERERQVGARGRVGEVDDPRGPVGHHDAHCQRGDDRTCAEAEDQVGELGGDGVVRGRRRS